MVLQGFFRKLVRKRIGLAIAALLYSFFSGIIFHVPAHALTLPLVSADVQLPLGPTLNKVITPITNAVNSLTSPLPVSVTVNPSPDTLGATVAAPALGSTPQNNPILRVSAPVPSRVTVTPAQVPQTADPAPVEPQQSLANNNHLQTIDTEGSSAGDDTREPEPTNSPRPLLAGISNFFSSIPATVSTLADTIGGRNVGTLPIVVSFVFFMLTLAAIAGLVYMSNHGGTLVIGNLNLSKFAQAHDVTQLVTLIIVTVSLGIVAIFLTLTGL